MLEHPDITAMMATGYPSWYEEAKVVSRCEVCGEDIVEGETFYDIPGVGICHEDCLVEMLKDYERCEYL